MQPQACFNHSLLHPTATKKDIAQLCFTAKQHHLHSVCVNSCNVLVAKRNLAKSEVKICAAIAFPFGASSTESKVIEAKKAIEDGADEIDMVMNIGMFKSENYVGVYKDIREVKLAIQNTPLKVTIEISELSKNEILKICQICIDTKVEYIKTSTGFSKSGATLIAVKIIKKIVKGQLKIEASGGIIDYATALKYVIAGANRISTTQASAVFGKKTEEKIIEKTTKTIRV